MLQERIYKAIRRRPEKMGNGYTMHSRAGDAASQEAIWTGREPEAKAARKSTKPVFGKLA